MSLICDIQFCVAGQVGQGEVAYYLSYIVNGKRMVMAMVRPYTLPEPSMLEKSHGVVQMCLRGQDSDMVVLDAKDISSVVAMVPLTLMDVPWFFVVERMGSDIMALVGNMESMGED